MPHAYTEDELVEQPAIELFAELRRGQILNFRQTRELLLTRLLSGQVGLKTEAA